jgi:hypothetical protein
MTLWYNAPKDNDVIGSIKGSFEKCVSSFNCSIGKIYKNDDDSIDLLMKLVTTPNDVKQYGNNNLDLTNQYVTLTFHSKEYEKNVKGDNGSYNKVKCEPRYLEIAFAKAVEYLGITNETVFRGTINLFDNNQLLVPIVEKRTLKFGVAKELSDTEISFFVNQLIDIEIIETTEELPVINKDKKGNTNKPKYIAPNEALDIKFKWLTTNLKCEEEVTNLVDLIVVVILLLVLEITLML